MNLVIVESPTKSKTISKFLGPDYQVLSSYGHIRDLPERRLGVDIEHNFEPQYVVSKKSKEKVRPLKTALKKADNLILATDEDREGEAIAWHLLNILKPKNYQRIVFHEITKPAILESLKNPREINHHLVDAQQARRILDRLVGYKLSPFLWKKIGKGLSAGRVQSVAVRLIAEREQVIEKFKPQEYWSLGAIFKEGFKANLKKELKKELEIKKILKDLKNKEYIINKITNKETKRNPLAPFITSTMQQDAAIRLGLSARKTMLAAQKLYEKGLITYHRTDSVNLSPLFIQQAQNYLPPKYFEAKKYQSRSKNAQEAHEAIRPTNINKKIKDNLYTLIWQRALASQMKPALIDEQVIDIKAGNELFRANGQTIKFDGFLKIYPLKISENMLPELKLKQILNLDKLDPQQHFTKPPARYTEASLVKELERQGIGRPSTYASIIYTILKRGYVRKEQKSFHPRDIGLMVNNVLVKHFPTVVDIGFTANMENDLDAIAQGKKKWQPLIKDFYQPFDKNLQEKYIKVKKMVEKTKEKCEKCGKEMVIKLGRFGKFLACSGFPDCKNAKPLIVPTGVKCPECKQGDLVEKRVRKSGKIFWGCNKYPDCEHATWDNPTKGRVAEPGRVQTGSSKAKKKKKE